MSKRFVITEDEKKGIRSLYKLDENLVDDVIGYIEQDGPKFVDKIGDFFGIGYGDEKEVKSDEESSFKDDVSKMSPEEIKKFSKQVKFGDVKLKGSFDSEQKRNISLLIDEMKNKGITNPYAQIGILSVIGKESGFKPKGEFSYATTSNQRIRKIFGNRVAKYSNEELNSLKQDQKKFFNVVYAKTVGNQGGEDGWIYRGRGFNQLTGKKNYERWGNIIGMGDKLVKNPELLNKPETAAKLAIAFLTNSGKKQDFTSKEDAAEYFADINAGGRGSSHRNSAIEQSRKFDVEIKGLS
jgi:predicted chitinase